MKTILYFTRDGIGAIDFQANIFYHPSGAGQDAAADEWREDGEEYAG